MPSDPNATIVRRARRRLRAVQYEVAAITGEIDGLVQRRETLIARVDELHMLIEDAGKENPDAE